MTRNAWMVRAGEGGHLIEEFLKTNEVSVSWDEVGEITAKTQRELRQMLTAVYPDAKAGRNQNTASVLWRFAREIKIGDIVVTADPSRREYHLGEITSDYRFDAKRKRHRHVRDVRWQAVVSRDVLSVAARNTLGSTLALFLVPKDVMDELQAAAKGEKKPEAAGGLADKREELQQSNKDAAEEARQLIEDRILELEPYEMQELVAAILRALGYRTRVSPPGSDRGVDVQASPDGLGLQEPRIKVEVKHRPNTAMGSQELRSFIGTLRDGDRGLYVSTGGFSKEARYEAERSRIPVTQVDLSELAQLVVDHYDNFDTQGRALIPLVRIYRPTE